MQDSLVQHIPVEIIIEILSRLPVKHLLRFKCVSKQWKSLISDPKFRLSTKGRKRAFVSVRPYAHDATKACFYSVDDQLVVQQLPNPLPNILPSQSVRLSSCDGLLLFNVFTGDCLISMYLWNPSTRSCCTEVLHLNLYESFEIISVTSLLTSGLCFDESTDSYKAVLWISCCKRKHEATVAQESLVLIANLRNKELTIINFPYRFGGPGPLLNGRLHWMVEETSSKSYSIIYFDAKSNSFVKFPTPEPALHNQGDLHVVLRWGLGVLDECLCMFRPAGRSGDRIDALIMSEYGVKESWTTSFSLTGTKLSKMLTTRPIFSVKNKEDILVYDATQLGVFNMKDKSLSNIHLTNNLPDGQKYFAHIQYVESLASVPEHGPNQRPEAEANGLTL